MTDLPFYIVFVILDGLASLLLFVKYRSCLQEYNAKNIIPGSVYIWM